MSWWLPTTKSLHCYSISVILLLLWITCYAGYGTCDPRGVAAHMLRTADLGKSSFYGDKILSLRKSVIWPSNMSQMSDSGDDCQVKLFWQVLPYLKEKLTGYLTKHSWVSTKSKCLFDHLLPSSSIKLATLFLLLLLSEPLRPFSPSILSLEISTCSKNLARGS